MTKPRRTRRPAGKRSDPACRWFVGWKTDDAKKCGNCRYWRREAAADGCWNPDWLKEKGVSNV